MESESVRDLSGWRITERVHGVPLDHARPGGETIEVFTREVADVDGLDRPLLVYLQGGPGFESPRPSRRGDRPPWLATALESFRVLLLDQRGTGRSTPVGSALPGSPEEQADYLANFRADSIVADLELIRAALGIDRWSLLGQSFGGFCSLRYMSAAPDSLREVMFAGGLPALELSVDEVYRATYARMRERSAAYYRRYPEDRAGVLALAERLAAEPVRLPSGDHFDARWLRATGMVLGVGDGAEELHELLELDADSTAFAHDAERLNPFPRNPIYAVLHESCWADGEATRWSAERVLAELAWDPADLTGEHIFRWMFDDMQGLRALAPAAELLAQREWPRLYDLEALESSTVPAAAIVYGDDVYVERAISEATARRIPSLDVWLTNEYEHDGIHADGKRVFGRLLDLARRRV